MSNPELQTVTGLVIPSRWEENGEISGLTIAAFDETEYHVKSCSDPQRLIQMLHREIEAEGRVERQGRSCFIDVLQFREKRDSNIHLVKHRDGAKREISLL